MSDMPVVVTLFNILNVVLLVAVLAYVFRTRLKVSLIGAIERVRLARKQLQNDAANAEQTYAQLRNELDVQHQFARTAEQNLAAWRAHEQTQEAAKRVEGDVQVAKVAEKQIRQAVYVQQYRAQMTLLPTAFEQAQQQLEKKYRDPHAGASYLETISKEVS